MLVKPAQVITLDHKKSLSVIDTLLKPNENSPSQSITNSKVYLISRGCVYEHLKQDFRPETLDRQFSKRNRAISMHLAERKFSKKPKPNDMKNKLKILTQR